MSCYVSPHAAAREASAWPRVIDLHSRPREVTEAEVGGKAINLMRMATAGLAVPGGIVLPVNFFAPWLAALRASAHWRALANSTTFDADDVELRTAYVGLHALAQTLELDAAQRGALAAFRAELGPDDRVCVRSSSPREDLEGSSFAGAYESVVGVTLDTLDAAIRRVFASCFDVRVAIYERSLGRGFAMPKIAVVIQRQIDSDKAGVGFSINPLDNDYDRATFNANWGQGETVVSGLAEPDAFIVDKRSLEICERRLGAKQVSIRLAPGGGTITQQDPRHAQLCLDDAELAALTRALVRVEEVYAQPMDIEWAFAGGELFLLQARPITTYHPLADELRTAPGQPRRLYLDVTMSVQGILEPLSAMGTAVLGRLLLAAGDEVVGLDELPGPGRSMVHATSSGRLYADLCNANALVGKSKLLAVLGQMDGLVHDAVGELDFAAFAPGHLRRVPIIFGALARMHRRLSGFARAMLRPAAARERWERLWHVHQLELRALAETEPRLDAFLTAVVGAAIRFMARETAIYLPVAKLALARARALFPDPSAQTQQLLDKLDQSLPGNLTVEMGHALYQLRASLDPARLEDPAALREAIDAGAAPAAFLAGWSAFLDRYGHRGMLEIDVAAPRYREAPELLLAQVIEFARDTSGQSPIERHAAAQRERHAAVEALAASLHGRRRARLRRWARTVELLGGMRESHKFVIVHAIDAIRSRLLEVGAGLVAAGRIDRVDDLFFLDLAALERGLADPGHDLRGPIDAGRARRLRDRQCKQVFPLIDSRGRFHRPTPRPLQPGELGGRGVSAGIARGPVKVLASPDDKPLRPGDILVARATDPSWTPLFVNAAAIVLEIGGPLQHGALVAREYGKPCVCGIEGATERLRDLELVEVDGDAGIIRRLAT
ncbi:MAG: hypothetical protein KC457_14830 [Myxococcales bacterium]|nr:hypothetical protein [Myxococcales bacterium]